MITFPSHSNTRGASSDTVLVNKQKTDEIIYLYLLQIPWRKENFVKSVCVFNIALKSLVTSLCTDPEAEEHSFTTILAPKSTMEGFLFLLPCYSLQRSRTRYRMPLVVCRHQEAVGWVMSADSAFG